MKRLTTALFLPLIFTFSAYSQGNILKANLTSLALKDVYVSYERTFLKKFSVNLGFDYLPKRGIPLASYFADVNGNPSPVRDMRISGWRITPEFRFYTSVLKGAPKGFYVAPYFRYGVYDFKLGSYQYNYTDGYDGNKSKTANIDFTGQYKAVGGGIMIGHQWIIAKHLSIDFWIVGIGVSGTNFALRGTTNDMDPRYFEEGSTFSEDIKGYLKVLNEVSISTGSNYVEAGSNNVFLGVRGLGFNVGYAF